MPAGFLMGFAFPTGMKMVNTISREPAAWFWGINGATGVLASTLAVMIGIAMGINVTMMLAAGCYLLLIPAALALLRRATASQPRDTDVRRSGLSRSASYSTRRHRRGRAFRRLW
jgi:hypothetical protein